MNKTGTNLKMLSANLQVELVDDLLHFHNKGNICVDKNFRNRIVPFPLSLEQLEVLQHNDFEISPFHDDAISCAVSSDLKLLRHSSAQDFGKSEIAFSKIQELLQNSFATLPRGGRPYPSGAQFILSKLFVSFFGTN